MVESDAIRRDGAGGDEEDAGNQIRVSLVLSSTVDDRTLEVPTEPIAVPSDVRRRGLSAVVNHLLERRVPSTEDGSSSGDDEDEDDGPPSIPFDFAVNGRLLRTGIESAARRDGLSLEAAVVVNYFPAARAPAKSGETEEFPDWITAMSYSDRGGGGGGEGTLCAGSADGSVRTYVATASGREEEDGGEGRAGVGRLEEAGRIVGAHSGPIKCVSSASVGDDDDVVLLATGSMDQTLLTHSLANGGRIAEPPTPLLHASYEGGHFASVGSVAIRSRAGTSTSMISGDWDGGVCVWRVPPPPRRSDDDDGGGGGGEADDANVPASKVERKKKRRTSTGGSSSTGGEGVAARSVQPSASWKAHASNVSGVAWGRSSSSSSHADGAAAAVVVTGSWDHSLKVWDVERRDCVLTLNGSRVVTCLDRCRTSDDVVATGHPDCAVRLWDVRVGKHGGKAGPGGVSDTILKPSHKAWVSAVRWSPTDPYVLATTSHDGTVKTWDIRCSLPLHTVRAHAKGEKGLCLSFGDGVIYSGGSDRAVKKFVC